MNDDAGFREVFRGDLSSVELARPLPSRTLSRRETALARPLTSRTLSRRETALARPLPSRTLSLRERALARPLPPFLLMRRFVRGEIHPFSNIGHVPPGERSEIACLLLLALAQRAPIVA